MNCLSSFLLWTSKSGNRSCWVLFIFFLNESKTWLCTSLLTLRPRVKDASRVIPSLWGWRSKSAPLPTFGVTTWRCSGESMAICSCGIMTVSQRWSSEYRLIGQRISWEWNKGLSLAAGVLAQREEWMLFFRFLWSFLLVSNWRLKKTLMS